MQVKTGKLLRGLRVQDVMSTDSYTVDPEVSLQEFVHEHLMRTGRRCFLVVQDGRLLGLITPNEVRAVEPRAWPFTPVRSVMRSADKVHFVSPDMPAMEALETMAREDVNQLPVIRVDQYRRCGVSCSCAAGTAITGGAEVAPQFAPSRMER